jgi:glyoxylase-like metal-dependent hydrolase (beta-lactamase superfamily II)
MREVADGVWQMPGLIPHLINTWLVRIPEGEMLIDAGTRWATGRILRQLHGRKLAMVGLTHVHPDHQGAVAGVCHRFQVPLACHAADAEVMEGRQPMGPEGWLVRLAERLLAGPPHPVSVRWQGGEMLGEWRILHAPGHTPGHVIFFRDRDQTVIAGDVVRNFSLRGGFGQLSETPHVFSVDPMLNRQSMRLLADLGPALLCLGHGPPHRDKGELRRLVERVEPMSSGGAATQPP